MFIIFEDPNDLLFTYSDLNLFATTICKTSINYVFFHSQYQLYNRTRKTFSVKVIR